MKNRSEGLIKNGLIENERYNLTATIPEAIEFSNYGTFYNFNRNI